MKFVLFVEDFRVCYIAVGVRTFFKEVQVDIEVMNV